MPIPAKKSSLEYLQECREALSAEQAQSLKESDNWAHLDKPQVHRDWEALYKELAPLLGKSAATSLEVQTLMARHHAIASRFYPPSKQAYIGLSLFYAENEAMKNFHNAYHPDMVNFLGAAMQIYAHKHL